jgi:hypothetical protein
MDAILRLFKPSGSFNREEVATRIKNAAAMLNAQLKMRYESPTGGQRKAALGQLAFLLASAHDLLCSLDLYSKEDLARIAAGAERQSYEPPPPPTLPLNVLGRQRVHMAKTYVQALLAWAQAAEKEIDPTPRGRDSFDDVERLFAKKLRNLWREAIPRGLRGRRKPPPQADFLAFIRAAIAPVCENYGYSPKLDNICKELSW